MKTHQEALRDMMREEYEKHVALLERTRAEVAKHLAVIDDQLVAARAMLADVTKRGPG